jgi:hypothetical protein
VAAIQGVLKSEDMVSEEEALGDLQELMWKVHDPLNWKIDVKKRIEFIECGEW